MLRARRGFGVWINILRLLLCVLFMHLRCISLYRPKLHTYMCTYIWRYGALWVRVAEASMSLLMVSSCVHCGICIQSNKDDRQYLEA